MSLQSQSRPVLRCGSHALSLGERTFVMGVLNVTPDSFSDGGQLYDGGELRVARALAHAQAMIAAGADIIDVGGESTRPGAASVTSSQEQERVLPVIAALVGDGIDAISVDTRNADTARAALDAGARWLNDVSALSHDPQIVEVAKEAQGIVLMHARSTPDKMQSGEIVYDNVTAQIAEYLRERVRFAVAAGIEPERLLVDPGIGFGKTLEHNLTLTRDLLSFQSIGVAVLYGPSRKRFLGELCDEPVAAKRDAATLGAIGFAAMQGADVVRVHDVAGAKQALWVVDALSR